MNDLLLQLARYGSPMVAMHDEHWFCKINVTVNVTGAKFEIISDMTTHLTPLAAVQDCTERLQYAMAGFTRMAVADAPRLDRD